MRNRGCRLARVYRAASREYVAVDFGPGSVQIRIGKSLNDGADLLTQSECKQMISVSGYSVTVFKGGRQYHQSDRLNCWHWQSMW